MCQVKASQNFGRVLAPGLVPALACHLRDFYSREIPKQNAGLALNLTEAEPRNTRTLHLQLALISTNQAAVDRQISRLVDTHGVVTDLSRISTNSSGVGSVHRTDSEVRGGRGAPRCPLMDAFSW